MELVYLILPIIGAFLLLFIVCCCGKKVKELFHIPKEVVTGGYRIASTRDIDLERDLELPPRMPTPPQVTQPPLAVHFTGAQYLNSPTESSQVFCEEITEISDTSLLTPRVHGPRLSERDSGVYSVCENSVGGCGSSHGTPCPKPRLQQSQTRELLHSYSEDSQTSSSCHRLEDSSSCILNVRSRTCSGDTNNTDPILESEYELEDAGICIIHVSSMDYKEVPASQEEQDNVDTKDSQDTRVSHSDRDTSSPHMDNGTEDKSEGDEIHTGEKLTHLEIHGKTLLEESSVHGNTDDTAVSLQTGAVPQEDGIEETISNANKDDAEDDVEEVNHANYDDDDTESTQQQSQTVSGLPTSSPACDKSIPDISHD